MKAESSNPSEDLPNQEKNLYWTVYWWEKAALYTKVKEGSDQKGWIKKNGGPLRRGQTESGGEVNYGNENTIACVERLTLHGRKDRQMAACLKRLFTCKSEKYCRVKRGSFSVYYNIMNVRGFFRIILKQLVKCNFFT